MYCRIVLDKCVLYIRTRDDDPFFIQRRVFPMHQCINACLTTVYQWFIDRLLLYILHLGVRVALFPEQDEQLTRPRA